MRRSLFLLKDAIVWTTVLGCLMITAKSDPDSLNTISKDRTNYVDRFNIDNLDAFVKMRKFVMVMANTYTNDPLKSKMMFFEVSKAFEQKEVFFLIIDVNDASQEQLKAHELTVTPTIRLYIYGIPKHFTLQLTTSNLSEWIDQILLANYNVIDSIEGIHHQDRHYFVYANQDWVINNQAHFRVLAKLIAPLSIYTGLNEEELNKIIQSEIPDVPLFAFREIDSKAFPVDKDLSLKQKADYLIDNEFAQYMKCQEKVLKIIFDYRIPVLIYYGDGNMAIEEWDIVKSAHFHYKEYLLLIYVDVSSKDASCLKLMDFLNVYESSNLRILNLTKEIKRYSFTGTMERADIIFFITNYIEGNLKKYALNERIRKNSTFKGLEKANFKILKSVAKKLKKNALFYIHSNPDKIPGKDLEVLKLLKDILRSNQTFKLYVLNHDKNDVDGQYYGDLPLVFLLSRLGQIHYFEQPITVENLLAFLLQHVPYLKVEEPQWDENL